MFFAVFLVLIAIAIVLALSFTYFFPFFVRASELPGKYKNIGIEYHRLPAKYGSIRYKLYYPCQVASSTLGSKYYAPNQYFVDNAAIDGIYAFTRASDNAFPKFLYQLLNVCKYFKSTPIPCFENVEIINNNNNNNENGKFPLIIVSHGLAGNWDMYSQFCIGLSSFGIVVAMLEHSDKSASHTKLPNGNDLFYEKAHVIDKSTNEKVYYNKDVKWTREQIAQYRGPQIKIRIKQVKDFYYYCLENKKNKDKYSSSNVFNFMDLNNIFIYGHSFGGVTAVLACQEIYQEWQDEMDMVDMPSSDENDGSNNGNEKGKSGLCNLKGVITYEPWFEGVSDQRLKQEWNLPNLMIIGDKWKQFNVLFDTCKLACKSNEIENNNNKLNCLEHFKGFSHTDCCDVPCWAPQFLATKIGIKAKYHSNKQVLYLLTKRIVSFMIDAINTPQFTQRLMDGNDVTYDTKACENIEC